ncbi:MAG TPA: M24 family metallopeptidase [Bdellovibrionota bacterium]|jgi:Xaa-Pro aminopeptidase
MQGGADETVGEIFRVDLLERARDKTFQVIQEAAAQMKPGMTELDAKTLIQEIQTRLGAPKSWHPPQIRFGVNSVLPFGERGVEGVKLQTNDIFFFDIGPIFEGHEGDVGRPFVLGNDSDYLRCRDDVETVWKEVHGHWKETGATGAELYAFAEKQASSRGWKLLLNHANGHRISDFPHAAKARGSVEGWERHPAPNRWILEIQIRHPEMPFGAFYEDLLS